MNQKYKVDKIKIVFYAILGLSILNLLAYGIYTDYSPFSRVIFYDGHFAFKDFWECVNYNRGGHPYQNGSSYPAIVNLFYLIISKMVPTDSPILTDVYVTVNMNDQMLLFAFYMVSFCIFIGLINKNKFGNSVEKTGFSLLMVLSAPFIYMFERGNIIFVALLLIMFYVFEKDSKNKVVRELAYICLGLSAAIKIYPAVFGFLLLKDKKYIEATRTVIYGILFFIIPFFAFGGLSDFELMFKNMSVTNQEFKNILGYRIDMSATLEVLFRLLHFNISKYTMDEMFSVLPYIFMAFAIISCIFHKSNWKVMALLASMIVLVPGYSYVYTLIFYIIPIIFFLDTKDNRTWLDWVYLSGFAIIFIPIMFDAPDMLADFQIGHPYVLSTLIQGIATITLSFILTVEGLIYGVVYLRSKVSSKLLNNEEISHLEDLS